MICGVLYTGAAHAQQPASEPAQAQSLVGVELKGKAPVNPKTLDVELPKPQEAVLENGMQIALIEDHELPTFSLQLIVRGGGLADPPERRGLAAALAELLREGTAQRSSREIAEQLATLGSVMEAAASPASTHTSVAISGLIEHLDETLELAADVVRRPAFPQSEVDKYKARYLSQLQHRRSLPSFIAQEQFMRAVYGRHPAGLVLPSEEVIASLTSKELVEHHARSWRPNNIIMLAYGDLTLKQLTAKVEHAFGDWSQHEVAPAPRLDSPAPRKARTLLVHRPGSVQTSLWLGALGVERNSADYFAVLVMNHILGGGPASRLFLNLREDKGYTYGVYSAFTSSTFPGVVLATTDVRTQATEGALHELMAELRRIAEEPVSAQELDNAKRALIGRFALSLDSPQALMANLAAQKIYDLPPDYWDVYPQRVAAVDARDVQRVARKYYAPERLQIVAVGDQAEVRKALEHYGEVHTPQARE
jgi:zinc protease